MPSQSLIGHALLITHWACPLVLDLPYQLLIVHSLLVTHEMPFWACHLNHSLGVPSQLLIGCALSVTHCTCLPNWSWLDMPSQSLIKHDLLVAHWACPFNHSLEIPSTYSLNFPYRSLSGHAFSLECPLSHLLDMPFSHNLDIPSQSLIGHVLSITHWSCPLSHSLIMPIGHSLLVTNWTCPLCHLLDMSPSPMMYQHDLGVCCIWPSWVETILNQSINQMPWSPSLTMHVPAFRWSH